MKKKLINNIMAFTALVLFFVTTNASAIDIGGIKGQVNFCGKGGVEGMLVAIPGRQFIVATDNTGTFLFDILPVGEYDIHYLLNGKKLNHNNKIKVLKDQVIQMGTVSFCMENMSQTIQPSPSPMTTNSTTANTTSQSTDVDKDKDGITAINDCDDNNADIRPGALEICDGLDNNCNGQVDEMGEFTIAHAIATCTNGQAKIARCDNNFSDCDLDASNGCETDLYSDNENCGACGNFCSDLESCALGTC